MLRGKPKIIIQPEREIDSRDFLKVLHEYIRNVQQETGFPTKVEFTITLSGLKMDTLMHNKGMDKVYGLPMEIPLVELKSPAPMDQNRYIHKSMGMIQSALNAPPKEEKGESDAGSNTKD